MHLCTIPGRGLPVVLPASVPIASKTSRATSPSYVTQTSTNVRRGSSGTLLRPNAGFAPCRTMVRPSEAHTGDVERLPDSDCRIPPVAEGRIF